MHWEDLRFVLALSRHHTLSRAASALRTTHTTVARRIRALEKQLGVRLFSFTDDGYVPTPAGQDVAEVAERTETELQALEARVVGQDLQLKGKLRVSTMDMVFRVYQPAFLSFANRHPGIELTVSSTDSEVSLQRREADVALRMTRSPPETLHGRKVGKVEFAPYASKKLVKRAGPKASLADFPWLHWDERLDGRWLDTWLAAHVPGARLSLRVDFSSLALQEAIAGSAGAHFLACAAGDADPRVVRIGPAEPAFTRDLWLLTLPALKGMSRVRAFFEHMTAALA